MVPPQWPKRWGSRLSRNWWMMCLQINLKSLKCAWMPRWHKRETLYRCLLTCRHHHLKASLLLRSRCSAVSASNVWLVRLAFKRPKCSTAMSASTTLTTSDVSKHSSKLKTQNLTKQTPRKQSAALNATLSHKKSFLPLSRRSMSRRMKTQTANRQRPQRHGVRSRRWWGGRCPKGRRLSRWGKSRWRGSKKCLWMMPLQKQTSFSDLYY